MHVMVLQLFLGKCCYNDIHCGSCIFFLFPDTVGVWVYSGDKQQWLTVRSHARKECSLETTPSPGKRRGFEARKECCMITQLTDVYFHGILV